MLLTPHLVSALSPPVGEHSLGLIGEHDMAHRISRMLSGVQAEGQTREAKGSGAAAGSGVSIRPLVDGGGRPTDPADPAPAGHRFLVREPGPWR